MFYGGRDPKEKENHEIYNMDFISCWGSPDLASILPDRQ